MKALLVAEQRNGELLSSCYELIAFANRLGAESAMFLVGAESALPNYEGTLHLADAGKYGEYNPEVHKQLLLETISREQPDLVVFSHSSYGWDLSPRISLAWNAAHVSEVLDIVNGVPVVPACNAKLRRKVKPKISRTVLTIQAGAFGLETMPTGHPQVVPVDTEQTTQLEFCGYEAAGDRSIDLSRADVIVSAGRGVGKPENIETICELAKALGAEIGASRPVVDAGWTEHNRQVGTTGQTVAPKLYIACGISGAIQHLAGMKKSEFVVAVNTDKDAPISEAADVLVVADLKEFVPVLTDKIKALRSQ